jgi:hypothetical protein
LGASAGDHPKSFLTEWREEPGMPRRQSPSRKARAARDQSAPASSPLPSAAPAASPAGSLYDRLLVRVKNNKLIAMTLLVAALITGLSTVAGKISELNKMLYHERAIVRTSLQPYHLISGKTGQVIEIDAVESDLDNLGKIIIDNVADKISQAIPEPDVEDVEIFLIGYSLYASSPVNANFSLSGPIQQSGPSYSLGNSELSGIDVRPLLSNRSLIRDWCKCIVFNISGKNKSSGEPITIKGDGFTEPLLSDENVKDMSNKRTIKIKTNRKVIVIDSIRVAGSTSEDVERSKLLVDTSLRGSLRSKNNVYISELTIIELEKKRDELRNLPESQVKSDTIDRFGADYLLSVSVIIEKNLRFFRFDG